ncbi:MAG: hypothetical protein CO127_02975 [Ignavibacteria bacterium CG_4_9_14_3_um_filter_36_18]|nr:MAG: hypothetical protein CO127_02975 [Ignavibacteria bacterium CG_4_9_14_3_um_filter_36_18]
MKRILNAILAALIFTFLSSVTKGQSEIVYEPGTDLTVTTGADICADIVTINGTYSGDGTKCDAALPVELSSFSAIIKGNKVELNWQTATEVNNYGFEIERSVVGDQRSANAAADSWTKIGFENGHGNSNSVKEYSFTDKPNGGAKFKYRLKQIDNDGKYEYSKEIEVDLITPNEFSLSQNYPNPFNPSTIIEYALPNNSRIKLELYSTTGELVAVLSEGEMPAGYHTYEFKSGRYNLSSGVYFYRLSAVENGTEKLYTSIKKMIMLK